MNKSTVIGWAGAIGLGAIGSGVWELVKPFLVASWEATIRLSTLGMDSLRDGIYADAAASLVRTSGGGVAVLAIAGLLLLCTGSVQHAIAISCPGPNQRVVRGYHVMMFVLSMMFLAAANREAYVSKLAGHYLRLEVLAAPHLGDLEIKRRRAAILQVADRKGFIEHVRQMATAVEAGGATAPSIDFL